MNCNSIKFTTDLAFRINQISAETRDLLASLKYSHAYGIGASISTTYLCNEFRLNGIIEKLFDDDIYKVGRFAPGSGKYVESLSNIPEDSNGLAIILAWQHSEKLRLRLRGVGFTGRVLIPLPTPTLIEF